MIVTISLLIGFIIFLCLAFVATPFILFWYKFSGDTSYTVAWEKMKLLHARNFIRAKKVAWFIPRVIIGIVQTIMFMIVWIGYVKKLQEKEEFGE